MKQISNLLCCDDLLDRCEVQTRLLPNPYRDLPYLLIKRFFDEVDCGVIARLVRDDLHGERAKVRATDEIGAVQPSLEPQFRKTVVHPLEAAYHTYYLERFAHFQPRIERFFNVALTTMTDVQVLEYTKGCYYVKHADDSSELVDEQGQTVCFVPVAPERKITTVLFATSWDPEIGDDVRFTGGELCFNYLYDASGATACLRAQAGDMIVFPSNPYFSHEVRPVRSGTRITLVQWHNALVE